MTGPHHQTRPISTAELLARNGTIGASPVGGGRHRRRGNSDAVNIAELTGEIPALPEEQHHEAIAEPAPSQGTAEPDDDEPGIDAPVVERMRPDPVIDDEDDEKTADVLLEGLPANDEDDDLPAYLRSIRATLFGGPARDDRASDEPFGAEVDDVDGLDHKDRDVDTGSRPPTLTDMPTETTTVEEGHDLGELDAHTPPIRIQTAWRAGVIVLQSTVAVAFGAALFIVFDQLWRWNNIVALVLSLLVILGLVVAGRVVRKTEGIASTLIAVAVGAVVTLGPLALMQLG
jgi:hypothetical protein